MVQEPQFLNYALEVATKMDNPHVIGVLVQCGATNVESCTGIAKTNEKHNALIVLLLILAAQTGNLDKSVLQKVSEKQNSIPTVVFRDTETKKAIFMNDIQRNYLMYSMAPPLEIARRSGHTSMRDRLLFILGVSTYLAMSIGMGFNYSNLKLNG